MKTTELRQHARKQMLTLSSQAVASHLWQRPRRLRIPLQGPPLFATMARPEQATPAFPQARASRV